MKNQSNLGEKRKIVHFYTQNVLIAKETVMTHKNQTLLQKTKVL